jgi:hypothetical protein
MIKRRSRACRAVVVAVVVAGVVISRVARARVDGALDGRARVEIKLRSDWRALIKLNSDSLYDETAGRSPLESSRRVSGRPREINGRTGRVVRRRWSAASSAGPQSDLLGPASRLALKQTSPCDCFASSGGPLARPHRRGPIYICAPPMDWPRAVATISITRPDGASASLNFSRPRVAAGFVLGAPRAPSAALPLAALDASRSRTRFAPN